MNILIELQNVFGEFPYEEEEEDLSELNDEIGDFKKVNRKEWDKQNGTSVN